MEKRLDRDPALKERYASTIKDIQKEDVIEVPSVEFFETSPRNWYSPHHSVQHPLKPDKVRRVLNGAQNIPRCFAKLRPSSWTCSSSNVATNFVEVSTTPICGLGILSLANDLIQLFSIGGFKLIKWISNAPLLADRLNTFADSHHNRQTKLSSASSIQEDIEKTRTKTMWSPLQRTSDSTLPKKRLPVRDITLLDLVR